MEYQYQFTNKATGKKIIAQSWNEYYKLQCSKDYTQCSKRYGIASLPMSKYSTYKDAERLNKFWEGARGYEKVSKVKCTGVPASGAYNGMRLLLTNIHNHACMQGDLETVNKTNDSDKWFWNNDRIFNLALPEHK